MDTLPRSIGCNPLPTGITTNAGQKLTWEFSSGDLLKTGFIVSRIFDVAHHPFFAEISKSVCELDRHAWKVVPQCLSPLLL
jgi:hypothetical protein